MTKLDPYKNFRFLLEIDGIHHAGFNEVSGLEEIFGTDSHTEVAKSTHQAPWWELIGSAFSSEMM